MFMAIEKNVFEKISTGQKVGQMDTIGSIYFNPCTLNQMSTYFWSKSLSINIHVRSWSVGYCVRVHICVSKDIFASSSEFLRSQLYCFSELMFLIAECNDVFLF